jgi:hypothetical protein
LAGVSGVGVRAFRVPIRVGCVRTGDFVERVGASDGHTARAMGLAALPYPRIARATSPSQRRGL